MPETKVNGTTPANAGGILFATPARETAANVETLYAESFEHLYAIICGLFRKDWNHGPPSKQKRPTVPRAFP